ncbi:NAD(P)H-dependent oxidoreductase [Halomonas campaniensis]|jgi:NAD(P)H dehydrogenase (quinone)|uniref:NADPH quinone oxidoreductase n=1 Tax=Halomonas campaniensis TaxID=213554 RepID=A0A246RZY4_9GAMM|nr:NAD(P)H-dependent oxidoreductase [Halomonas campaniensis]OWV29733.1 NADPH quinone oxidoreductase [Halomonas campaniensis]
MNVLIVHAHPEPRSFNAALTKTAVETLSSRGYHVEVSDLYAMGWSPALSPDEFADLGEGDYFNPAKAQEIAYASERVCGDVVREQAKVRDADLLIFQFPIWWFSMPAILKGWVDRVLSRGFAYASGRKYDKGMFRGKRALLSLTTGTASSLYQPNGIDGDLNHILWPIHNGVLAYTGFTVLPPFAAWMPAQVSAEQREDYLSAYKQHLDGLDELTPLFFHPREDYDDNQQLKPGVVAQSGVQWNPSAGQSFAQSAESNKRR